MQILPKILVYINLNIFSEPNFAKLSTNTIHRWDSMKVLNSHDIVEYEWGLSYCILTLLLPCSIFEASDFWWPHQTLTLTSASASEIGNHCNKWRVQLLTSWSQVPSIPRHRPHAVLRLGSVFNTLQASACRVAMDLNLYLWLCRYANPVLQNQGQSQSLA